MSNDVLAGLLGICMFLPFLVCYIASIVNEHHALDRLWVRIIFPVAWLVSVGVGIAVATEGQKRFNHSGMFWLYWALFGFLGFCSLLGLVQELETEQPDD